ncbi:MAG: 30S ribosomal protein S18 [Candidatus Paceibacterota bacterium]
MDCYFCRKNIDKVDHKNVGLLRNYLSASGKIKSRLKTGLCATHQRKVSKAIKTMRNLGILSASAKYQTR